MVERVLHNLYYIILYYEQLVLPSRCRGERDRLGTPFACSFDLLPVILGLLYL